MTIDPDRVAERVAAVRQRINELATSPVSLVAVTKTFGVDAIDAAVRAGCDAIGENYAQELIAKVREGFESVPVHFIGHIQSNKVRQLVPLVDLWQTVDRPSVAEELARRGGPTAPRVLIQVNCTAEPHKGGVSPGALDDLLALAVTRGLTVEGLMTMGPTTPDMGATEDAFRLLRRLADERGLRECSMGMSDDFEIAVRCGSTMVRIGSRLFGERKSP